MRTKAFFPSTQEAEAGRIMHIPSQPGLQGSQASQVYTVRPPISKIEMVVSLLSASLWFLLFYTLQGFMWPELAHYAVWSS